MGFSEGSILFDITYLPTFGVDFHSHVHILAVDILALHLALDLVVVKGIWQFRAVASFARESAFSLPMISQWLGHQDTDMRRLGWSSRFLQM